MVYSFSEEVRVKVRRKPRPRSAIGAVLYVAWHKLLYLLRLYQPVHGRYSFRNNLILQMMQYKVNKEFDFSVIRLYPDPDDPGYYKTHK